MSIRRDIIVTIKNAIEGLDVVVGGQHRQIHTKTTLFDPADEAYLPVFSVTPAAETIPVGIMGLTMDRTLTIGAYGFVDGGSLVTEDDKGFSQLFEAAENCVEAILAKLTSSIFLDNVACSFSIIGFGPITVEHAEHENPLAYINIPINVQWVE